MYAPDDVVTVLPVRSNGIDHDLGLGDGGFNRPVIPNVYNQNPDFIIELEFPLEVFQLLL